ncbi:hypothetical protein [Bacteroides sp. UBA939]|uniref:hypothetical protein n=1 Tax=Bacteroides sp. UBA939 TaxID=1946092 RepID=UPI0025C00FA0|nr:hypothetical protein [Bacteroides sp. UBA939]
MLNTEHAGDMAMMTLTAISDGGWGNGEWGIVGPGIGGGTDEPQSWYQRKTSRCSLQLGNGWFTSSIMMECVFCAVPSSCTPLPCGF